MIAVDNLKMQFGSEEILKGISTVFEQGKTNLIIGQSGSGKSVTVKMSYWFVKTRCRKNFLPQQTHRSNESSAADVFSEKK